MEHLCRTDDKLLESLCGRVKEKKNGKSSAWKGITASSGRQKDWMERNSAEKSLGLVADRNLYMSQICVLIEEKTNGVLDCLNYPLLIGII